MYKDKKILALIPARGGSKGLPRKNIKPLLGKNLIGWTIEQAKDSSYIDYVYVSTEDKEIADISKSFGAEIPFMRPMELAEDLSSSIDVILFTIEKFYSMGNNFDIIVLLEPTSPLRDTNDIDLAIESLLKHEGAESVVGVSKVESCHPDFLVKINEKSFISSFIEKDFSHKRRQEIEELYFFEGSVYVSYLDSLKVNKSFYTNKTIGYIFPKWKSYEIDELSDFIIIEALMRAKMNKEIQ